LNLFVECYIFQTQPFLFPVSTKEVPDYYKFVKIPMDMQTIRDVRYYYTELLPFDLTIKGYKVNHYYTELLFIGYLYQYIFWISPSRDIVNINKLNSITQNYLLV
jgi:hypothetical protein